MGECLYIQKNGEKCKKCIDNNLVLCKNHKNNKQKGGGKYLLNNSVGLSALGFIKFNKKIDNFLSNKNSRKNK